MKRIRRFIAALGSQTGFFDVYASLKSKIIKSRLAILMYHRVAPETDDSSLEPMSPDIFQHQIQYLVQNYEILSLHQAVRCLAEKRLPQHRSVVITIDDGYRDNYTYAYPILSKHHAPATIFLIAGCIGTGELFWWDKVAYIIRHTDVSHLQLGQLGAYSFAADKSRAISMINRALTNLPDPRRRQLIGKLVELCRVEVPRDIGTKMVLSWDQVIEMSKNGIDFGAHTLTHPILTNVSPDEARREVELSKWEIESRLGKAVDFFSYPLGVYDTKVVNIVKESGFIGAVTVDPNLIGVGTDAYLLGRVPGSNDFDTLKAVLSGFYGDMHSILK